MSDAVLSLRDVTRTYESGDEELHVLRGVNLDLQPGEIVGLIGPSGSGKSTLLHIAGLLEPPDGGSVRLDGIDAVNASDDVRTGLRRNYIGFVYQFHHLLPEFDALENVVLPRLIHGELRNKAIPEATRLLTALGLEDRLTHRPAELSGGEQQRVAIARAFANNPKLILADEPTGNLDPKTSDAVFASFRDAARDEGVSALVATHNIGLVERMDRVLALENGELVSYQPTE
ncbi:ABC transporter ATP-binding protein [Hyphobacterium sp. HN65]|uniref:ABC transporter ATP-binding protein n=1 Tax=Hyphobacterium lacteum TaxID=3116575 RepID=A0ABU7LMS0_9PROT|nr:ABC transporter ATP-binding protein [Hyphobacterium sp. HN65]MEE2524889.1 ABC transporter ATP-binding protein [Hyphobacterium sp. HN65]